MLTHNRDELDSREAKRPKYDLNKASYDVDSLKPNTHYGVMSESVSSISSDPTTPQSDNISHSSDLSWTLENAAQPSSCPPSPSLKFRLGYRHDCQKCLDNVAGHYAHWVLDSSH